LATSDNQDNLKLHASIYGYSAITISPANLVGELVFFTDQLPVVISTIDKIVLSKLRIAVGGINFIMDSTYSLYQDVCEIIDSKGEITHIPYDVTTGKLPLIDFNQYEVETVEFTLPYYVYGTHYQKIIELGISGSSIYQYDVLIKLKDSDEWVSFNTSTVKYYAAASDEIVFSRNLVNNQVLFEFGSGINGKYVPEAQVKIKLKYTNGSAGNILTNIVRPIDGSIFVFDANGDNIYSGNVTSLISINIDYATGGIDDLEHNDLRQAIIKFVQSRNNLISKNDFYNILDKYLSDFVLLFKKINIVDNTIYAFVPFKDKYFKPILSKSISLQYALFNYSNKAIVYKPQFSIGGSDYISPFVYIYDSFTRTFAGNLYREKYSTYFSSIDVIDGSSITIPLSLMFDYNQNIRTTRIVVQSYQKISDYVMFVDIPNLGVYSCMTVYDDNNQEFLYINDITDGLITIIFDVKIHVFKDNVSIFVYTVKNVNLLQDLSDILKLGLYEFLPEYSETGGTGPGGTGQIGSDPLHPGIGWVYTGGGTPSSKVGGEGWFLPQTGFVGMSGGTNVGGWKPDLPYIYMADFIMNIPVMLYDDYDSNSNYYDQKFINTLGQISIDENRMISDDFQIRFLNTEIIERNELKNITIQHHDFRLKLPLQLNIVIGVQQSLLVKNNINVLDFKDELINKLATQLVDKYTGVSVSFYHSQIVDIVHDIEWVKYCTVYVYDSTTPQRNEIFNANIELIDQSKLEISMSKFEAATFCPVYLWWDLDKINIELVFD